MAKGSNRMASGAYSIKITGSKEAASAMNSLAKRVQEQIFIRAVQPSLKLIVASAKSNVVALQSKEGGETGVRAAIASRTAIKLQRSKGSRYFSRGKVAVFYGRARKGVPKQRAGTRLPMWGKASLAHLLEFGYNLTHYFGRKIRARRIAPRPFMKPAFETNKQEAESLFRSVIKSELGRTSAK